MAYPVIHKDKRNGNLDGFLGQVGWNIITTVITVLVKVLEPNKKTGPIYDIRKMKGTGYK
jgi:hypothetical protein